MEALFFEILVVDLRAETCYGSRLFRFSCCPLCLCFSVLCVHLHLHAQITAHGHKFKQGMFFICQSLVKHM